MLITASCRRVVLAVMTMSLVVTMAACTTKHTAPRPTTTSSASTSASASASASPTGADAVPADIAFSDCSYQFQTAINTAAARSMQFSCGKLAVPLSYADPSGGKVDLFVMRVHPKSQKQSDHLGSLLVNPGGPGESGINLAAGLVNALSPRLFAHFDLIGFDPRGVGLSAPVQCISDKQKDALAALDPDVRTAAGRAAAKAAAASVAKGCVAKYGSELADYNTEETARDMDVIRRAVGDAKLNYLGYSYGTRLGAVYAHEFPTRLRAMVLDGPQDPGTPTMQFLDEQTRALEQAFNQFAASCLATTACAVLKNPRAAVQALIASADRKPIPTSRKGDNRKATGGIVTIAVTAALYDPNSWPALGAALVNARRGDAAGLFTLADNYTGRDQTTGRYNSSLDAETTINCNDSATPISDTEVAATAGRWIAEYPLFGKNSAADLYNCYGWPPSGHQLPTASAPGAPPILVIGTVHDPITPYAQAGALAKALGSGVVLSWAGSGHTAYPKTACVRGVVDDYLISASAPSHDSCPAS